MSTGRTLTLYLSDLVVFFSFFFILTARCVSHKGKTFVLYHKVTVCFACGKREFWKISHWNACGKDRASAVTWQSPIPAEMFFAGGRWEILENSRLPQAKQTVIGLWYTTKSFLCGKHNAPTSQRKEKNGGRRGCRRRGKSRWTRECVRMPHAFLDLRDMHSFLCICVCMSENMPYFFHVSIHTSMSVD